MLGRNVQAIVMDGQALAFDADSFDKIILHLILAVIPDPIACINEASRVLKQGGTVAVFDKFVPKGRRISTKRRLVNLFANFLVSDITRDIESIVKDTGLKVLSDKEADL